MDLFNDKSEKCVIVDMARPSKPKTALAQRLIDVRGQVTREDFARSIEVIPGTYANYERGDAEPNSSVLGNLARVHGVNLHWLLTGQGSMLIGGDLTINSTKLSDIRRFIWNIAETYWEQTPRRTKPAAFADKFLEMFDYLLTREDVKEDAAAEVIQFGAEQLKRASGRDER